MQTTTFTISTWNVLADCYVHGQPRSTDTQLEQTDATKKIGDNNPIAWKNRSQLIAKCIREGDTDVLCLQEVDHYHDFYKKNLKELGYRPCFVQRPNRQDGCVIAFKTSKFTLIDLVTINCDDSICADSLYEHQKYLKHNVALFVRLRSVDGSKDIVVATCHIHWNPLRPEVKVSQIAYILQQLKDFQGEDGENGAVPVVLTGDFNTLPEDPIYRTLTDPVFNKNNNIAAMGNMLHNLRYGGELYGPQTRFLCDASLSKLCKWLRVLGVNCALDSWDNGVPASSTKHRNAAKWQWTSPTAATSATSATTTLIATAATTTESPPAPTDPATPLESTEGAPQPQLSPAVSASLAAKERHRAQFPMSGDPTYAARINSINTFFARAEREKRVILTTSRSLRERASCPKSFFIQAQKLEQGLIDIAVNFGLNLSRDRFLTVCGKCGDDVEEVNRTIDIENNTCIIHDERLEDKYMPIDRTVFACVNCAQPYWWNEKAGSLPALAMERAEQLYLMVCKGIEKREQQSGTASASASVSVSAGGKAGGKGDGNTDGAVVSIVEESATVAPVATPIIYQQQQQPASVTDSPASAPLTPLTSTPLPLPLSTASATSSPAAAHHKTIVKAGTCILKDFGRTAKNPTLKNLAINSDSLTQDGVSNGHNRVGSRSNSKSAELELEVSIQLSRMTVGDTTAAGDNSTVSDSTTSNGDGIHTSGHANDTTATATISAKPTGPMSMEALSQMFENRERNVKLARENSGSTVGGSNNSSNAGELIRGERSGSAKNNKLVSKSHQGLPLLSVFQLAARGKGLVTTHDDVNNVDNSDDLTVEKVEPELTNWNGEFKGTLDYIFVSNNIQLASSPAVLPPVQTSPHINSTVNSVSTSAVSDSVLTQVIITPQPSRLWPSDHFIVTATLQY